jgi:transglutaminase-like putative cysteine protease
MLAVAAGMAGCASAEAETAGPMHLEITGQHRLRITYDYTAVWPRGGGYSAAMRLPEPPPTGGQRIEHFSSTLTGQVRTDDDDPPHRILSATVSHGRGDDRELHWRIQIVGIFQTRQLVEGPRPDPTQPIVAPSPGEFLASTESINWDDDRFQDWLDRAGLRRQPGEAAVDYGRRVFDYLKENGRYSYPPETPWNAAAGCRRLRTDCGGFSLIFTAACRANKIPARLLVGQWFKTRELADGSLDLTGRQSHVIAEFFDPAIGWIPEDISSTMMKVPGFADTNFFGRDPGYFFAWHVDTDFHFQVPENPDEKVQWIQNPSLWFSANAEDAADSTSHHWSLETLPIQLSRGDH